MKDYDLVYSIDEMAKKLKISKSNAYQIARAENFPKIKLGKRILIPVDELKRWLEKECNKPNV